MEEGQQYFNDLKKRQGRIILSGRKKTGKNLLKMPQTCSRIARFVCQRTVEHKTPCRKLGFGKAKTAKNCYLVPINTWLPAARLWRICGAIRGKVGAVWCGSISTSPGRLIAL